MDIRSGDTIIAMRQACSNAFTGVAPVNVEGDEFTAYVDQTTRIVQYSNREDRTEKVATEAGLFDFSTEQAVYIREIRAHVTCGNITVIVGDRGNSDFDVAVNTPAPVRVVFERLPVAPSQVLKISTASGVAGGFVDVLFTKGTGH